MDSLDRPRDLAEGHARSADLDASFERLLGDLA